MEAQPQVERDIALDLVKHGLLIAPVVILVAGLVSGWDGTASAAIALGIVCLNFTLAALSVGWAAKISPVMVGGVALGGYVVRLGLILVALVLLRHVSWIVLPWLGFTLVGAHLVLLFWEMRYVSMSLAAPGLRPRLPIPTGEK
ncbi:MAG TPA: ATP synthase subunit I [Acidimicrobiia bacterium]|nr:ATP synthase subunit I [Acidimicrobiia bacterium]